MLNAGNTDMHLTLLFELLLVVLDREATHCSDFPSRNKKLLSALEEQRRPETKTVRHGRKERTRNALSAERGLPLASHCDPMGHHIPGSCQQEGSRFWMQILLTCSAGPTQDCPERGHTVPDAPGKWDVASSGELFLDSLFEDYCSRIK